MTKIFPSALHRLLMMTQPLEGNRVTRRLWRMTYQTACSHISSPIVTKIHGHSVHMGFSYAYPYFARRFPSLNRPLLEVVNQTFRTKNARIGLVDVGAAIGDTVLLVDANCPEMVERYYCVDGDDEFYGYLQKNIGERNDVVLRHALLSSSCARERALIRTHGGTASAQGEESVPSVTLDLLLSDQQLGRIDVLKVDVDGLDGRVLAGAVGILAASSPSVIFEWHPLLYQRTGNPWLEPFSVLRSAGYDEFVWFTKFGEFSHFTKSLDAEAIERLAEICIRNAHVPDWHYDIVAVHPKRRIDTLALAELEFAKRRRSQF